MTGRQGEARVWCKVGITFWRAPRHQHQRAYLFIRLVVTQFVSVYNRLLLFGTLHEKLWQRVTKAQRHECRGDPEAK